MYEARPAWLTLDRRLAKTFMCDRDESGPPSDLFRCSFYALRCQVVETPMFGGMDSSYSSLYSSSALAGLSLVDRLRNVGLL
jgi:hypothetical protein